MAEINESTNELAGDRNRSADENTSFNNKMIKQRAHVDNAPEDLEETQLLNRVDDCSQAPLSSLIDEDEMSVTVVAVKDSCSKLNRIETVESENKANENIENDNCSAERECNISKVKSEELSMVSQNLNDTAVDETNTNVVTPIASNLKRKKRGINVKCKKLVTSTPYAELRSGKRNMLNRSSIESSYTTPARSVLEKWKPTLLADHYEKVNFSSQSVCGDVENISAIGNPTDSEEAKTSSSLKSNGDNNEPNGFEVAFNSLYTTLFTCGDTDECSGLKSDKPTSNNFAKLELYRDNIVQQHKRDNEKLDEIISEISSMSNRHYITVDETGVVRNELSTITESDFEPLETTSNTIVAANDHETDKILCSEDKINDTIKDSEQLTIASCSTADVTLKNECDKETESEAIEVRVINGANSIIYLNNRELTLDEEDALLNSEDEDAISLACSDIGDVISSGSAIDANTKPSLTLFVPQSNTETDISNIKVKDEVKIKVEIKKEVDLDTQEHSGEIPPSNEIKQELKEEPAEIVVDPPVVDRNLPFISDDPKENEDNNDPQWEHLRRLKNDKERYRALRQRWHSVIIPDPNLDLTSQTFRQRRATEAKNNAGCSSSVEPKIESAADATINKNSKKRNRPISEPQDLDKEPPAKKMRKCTTLFEENIEQLLKKWEFKRFCLYLEMNDRFADLARKQEQEVYMYQGMSDKNLTNTKSFLQLHSHQVKEVENIREEYLTKISEAERQTRECVAALNAASDEVYTFHKFYQDLTPNDDTGCSMFLTDTQFKELVETENMLDLYSKFYK